MPRTKRRIQRSSDRGPSVSSEQIHFNFVTPKHFFYCYFLFLSSRAAISTCIWANLRWFPIFPIFVVLFLPFRQLFPKFRSLVCVRCCNCLLGSTTYWLGSSMKVVVHFAPKLETTRMSLTGHKHESSQKKTPQHWFRTGLASKRYTSLRSKTLFRKRVFRGKRRWERFNVALEEKMRGNFF